MMKAIRLPFKMLPLNESVCSKEDVTKEINDEPSAFMANKMIPISSVKAPIPK
jgi:hypothetical protein